MIPDHTSVWLKTILANVEVCDVVRYVTMSPYCNCPYKIKVKQSQR